MKTAGTTKNEERKMKINIILMVAGRNRLHTARCWAHTKRLDFSIIAIAIIAENGGGE